MDRRKLGEHLYLTVLPNSKFKRNKITINFMIPNRRETATAFALLPGVLERAYEDYPTMLEFSRKLNMMYSASLRTGTYVTGSNRSLRFSIQGIKNEYCLNGEDLLNDMCDVLLGVIFRPCLEDGHFVDEWLEIEKYKLKEEIQSEVNDKRGYCVRQARRLFFKDSMNGVERLGYEDEIDSVSSTGLYECYQQLLRSSSIEIFVSAEGADSITEKLVSAFAYERDGVTPPITTQLTPCENEVVVKDEQIDTVQGKICLIYTTTRLLKAEERFKMLVANAVFGGTVSSRLFKNVREKQSLCYYCAAGFSGFTSSMTVDSGVEHVNSQKAVDAIKKELSDLINGPISQKEIDEVKLTLKNSLMSSYDSLASLEAWYMNEAFIGTGLSPEDAVTVISEVSEEDIREMLKLLHLNVLYRIVR